MLNYIKLLLIVLPVLLMSCDTKDTETDDPALPGIWDGESSSGPVKMIIEKNNDEVIIKKLNIETEFYKVRYVYLDTDTTYIKIENGKFESDVIISGANRFYIDGDFNGNNYVRGSFTIGDFAGNNIQSESYNATK